MPQSIASLENEYLAFDLSDDASARIVQKSSQTTWRMRSVAMQEEGAIDVGHIWQRTGRSLCEQYPGRFRVNQVADQFRATLFGRLGAEMGSFSFTVSLDGPWLEFRLTDVDAKLPSLVFPPPIVCDSLVLPSGIGKWVQTPAGDPRFLNMFTHLSMRWFGGLTAKAGYLCIFTENHNDCGVMQNGLNASPAYLQSLDRWTPRAVRFRFVDGNYVTLARTFREWAIAHGLHVPLTRKIEQNPSLNDLVGGRMLSMFLADQSRMPSRLEDRFVEPTPQDRDHAGKLKVHLTYADAASVFAETTALGMTRGIYNIRGWINGGYDESHPDIFPPDPALGSEDELPKLLAKTDPLIAALHDNYQDIYQQSPSFPHGVVRGKDGAPLPGGYWAGGQAYIINPRDGLAYARRNWPRLAALHPRAMFIDTTTAVQTVQSWEPGNTLTRSQDESLKLELLQFFKSQGVLLGSEEAADFGMSEVDWLENRHTWVPGESIPLWPLVYHDAAICYRYKDPLAPTGNGSTAPNWLADVLWGYSLLYFFGPPPQWPDGKREGFANTMHVDRLHAEIATADLIDHRYLTPDRLVEQTRFSTGHTITANFSPGPRQVDGQTIPGHGYTR